MTTAYPKQFLDEYEVIDKSFHYPKNPNAKRERDSLARELRKAGWEVRTKKWVFNGDLCSGESYELHARRKVQQPQQVGRTSEPSAYAGATSQQLAAGGTAL